MASPSSAHRHHRRESVDPTTPLLGQVTGRDELMSTEPNIYVEVVEAPWHYISQRTTFIARFLLALLMTGVLIWHVMVEAFAHRLDLFFFRAMNLSWIAQCGYMWLVTYWTYLTTTATARTWLTPSTPPEPPELPRCFFNLSTFPSPYYSCATYAFYSFYTAVTLFPLCVTELYLTALLPHMLSHSLPLSIPEILINTLNSVVVVVEVVLLNTVTANTVLLSPRVRAAEIAFWVVVYLDIWVWLGNAEVDSVISTELDWRFLGDEWKDGGVWKTVWWVLGANAIYVVLWFCEVCKGMFIRC